MEGMDKRVTSVVARFEEYINKNALEMWHSKTAIPALSQNIINATHALPIASDSQPSLPPIVIDLVAKPQLPRANLLEADTAQSSLCD